jgi:hypothetical protein
MQYKLIKKFPASPELGTIVTKQKNRHYLYVNDLNDASLFYDREIENYPEFWEEVKERKPILVTEDGVGLFDNDEYYFLDTIAEHSYGKFTYIKESILAGCSPMEVEGRFRFSTEKAAQEYIKWNKPMYSLNDVSRSGASAESKVGVIEELEKLGRK